MRTILFERLGFHSAVISVSLHVLILLLVLYFQVFEEALKKMQPISMSEEKQKEAAKILIKLKGPEEKTETQSPFVSSISRAHSGKIKETQKGLNIVGDPFEDLFKPNQRFQRQNNGGFDLSLPKKEAEEKIIKDGERLKKEENIKKAREIGKKQEAIMPSKQGGVISEDSLITKMNIDNNVRFSVGAKGDVWAKLYLSYVDAIHDSFIRFASQRFLMGTSEVIFDTEISPNGKIIFKEFIKKSVNQPSLNYVGEKMIEYATPVIKVPKEIYKKVGKDTIPVRVKITYSSETGFWWVGFE